MEEDAHPSDSSSELPGQTEAAVNRQIRIQQALLDISTAVQAMLRPSDLERVMHACLTAVQQIGMDAQTMAIHRMVDENERAFETVRVGPQGTISASRRTTRRLTECWRSGGIVLQQDIEKESPEEIPVFLEKFRGIPIRCFLDCPFSRGVLSVHSVHPNAFFEADAEVLRAIGEIFAVGISRMEDLERITASQNALAAIVTSSEDAITAANQDRLFTDWNAAAERIFGYRAEEILGRPVSVLLPPDRQDEARQLFERVARGDRVVNHETVRVRKDGQAIQVSLTLSPVRDADGTITRLSAIIRDITEQKRTETALRRSERRFKELVDLLPQAVFEMDKQGDFTFVNRQGSELFGYTQADLDCGLNVLDMFVPEEHERIREQVRRQLSGETSSGNEYTAQRKNGSTFPVLAFSSPIFQGSRIVGIRGIAVDLTEKKHAEQQMLVYQKQLRSLAAQLALAEQQERRQLATDLHDRIGQTLATALLKLDEAKAQALPHEIGDALDEVRNLINQIYQNTRSLVFEISPPALHEQGLTVALQQLADEIFRQRGFRVDLTDDGQPKPLGEEFADFLFRAVRELLFNAAKHAQTDRVEVTLSRVGDNIRIEVADAGAGFDVSALEVGTLGVDRFGLFSIRERSDFLGGSFEIESEPGRGTQVTMELPLEHGG